MNDLNGTQGSTQATQPQQRSHTSASSSSLLPQSSQPTDHLSKLSNEEKCLIAQEASSVIHGYKKRLQHQLRLSHSLNSISSQAKSRSASCQSSRSNSISSNRSYTDDNNVNIKLENADSVSNNTATLNDVGSSNSDAKYQPKANKSPTQFSYDFSNEDEYFSNPNGQFNADRVILT